MNEARSRLGDGPYASRAGLEELLTQGWKIEPPVYARSDWQSLATSKRGNTYHFVLWRENSVNLVSVRESPEIQRFLSESELAVDYL